MNDERRKQIPAGQKILIGRPTQAPPEKTLFAINQAVSLLPTCLEVHLPQYFAIGAMPAPRLALVLVIGEDEDKEVFAQNAEKALAGSLVMPTQIDLWVLAPNDPLLPAVRRATCPLQVNGVNGEAEAAVTDGINSRLTQ